MQLIGMLDSPYVRRVAISLQLLGLEFEHRAISVFGDYDEIKRINSVVKVPTLVCDDGAVLVDSTLILEYADELKVSGRRLMPESLPERRFALQVIGFALAACEKSVQIVYERNLRPPEKQHHPWVRRITDQLSGAYHQIEVALAARPLAVGREHIDQAGISAAVAWQFTQQLIPDVVPASRHPLLAEHSSKAETLPEFISAPHGNGTYRPAH